MLPNGFAFLSGCATNIERNKILLIGGHYVKKFDSGRDEYEMITKSTLNDQVAEFNVLKRKWTILQSIPISMVRLLSDLDHLPLSIFLFYVHVSE